MVLQVLKEWHGILDCHYLMLEACELNSVSEEDYNDLGRAGLGNCLLGGLPDWLVAYAARLVCDLLPLCCVEVFYFLSSFILYFFLTHCVVVGEIY